MSWFYESDGKQCGPVSDAELEDLFRRGQVFPQTLVWREGMADWQPLTVARPSAHTPPQLPSLQSGEVVCAECGRVFPASETIRHGNANICAACKPVFLQKLSEGAKFDTGEMNYAGFGIRFAAKMLDGLILGIPMMVVAFLVMFPAIAAQTRTRGEPSFGMQLLPFLMQIGFLAVQLAYQTFFLGKFGATPGKMLCKIKVAMPDGSSFGYGRAAGRCMAEMLSNLTCYIGYLLVLFDNPQRRALHDHICNTRVIYK